MLSAAEICTWLLENYSKGTVPIVNIVCNTENATINLGCQQANITFWVPINTIQVILLLLLLLVLLLNAKNAYLQNPTLYIFDSMFADNHYLIIISMAAV